VKHGACVIWLFLKINLSRTISLKRSCRELSIDMFILRGIHKNKLITLFPGFTSIPETGVSFYYVGLPKTGIIFTVKIL